MISGPPRQALSEERSESDTVLANSSGDDDAQECEARVNGSGKDEVEGAEDDDSSEAEQEAEEDEDSSLLLGAHFCINCTSRLAADEDVCEDCGHAVANDADLFDAGSASCSQSGSDAASSTSSIALLYDERMELHDEGAASPHPERPDRVRAIVARLLASGLGRQCRRIACREATLPELCAVHSESLVRLVETASLGAGQGFSLTSDTYVNSHTYLCAKLASGGAAEVAALLARGEAQHGAAIVRPPGHHAESGMAMGFCFFNNAAVAARAAQAAGAQRVLILDWDVHHGNGTQHIFENDPSVLFMSLHRYEGGSFYPGTGDMLEVGLAEGRGYTVNVPWSTADVGNGDYIAAFQHVIVPIALEYNPDLIIVSAGFDAADGDPIGQCRVTPDGFGHMTSMLKAVAPCLLLLEGGYNLTSTAASTEACLRVLLGEQPDGLAGQRYPSAAGWKVLQDVVQVQSVFWRCLRSPTGAALFKSQVQEPAADLKAALSGVGKGASPSQVVACSSSRLGLSSTLAASSALGTKKKSLRMAASRNCHFLMKIHKQAMKAFWKRQRKTTAKAA